MRCYYPTFPFTLLFWCVIAWREKKTNDRCSDVWLLCSWVHKGRGKNNDLKWREEKMCCQKWVKELSKNGWRRCPKFSNVCNMRHSKAWTPEKSLFNTFLLTKVQSQNFGMSRRTINSHINNWLLIVSRSCLKKYNNNNKKNNNSDDNNLWRFLKLSHVK